MHCWSNPKARTDPYEERPKFTLHNDAKPLESVAPAAPRDIFYPLLTKGSLLEVYPSLPLKQPWFSAEGIENWPQIIEVDRVFIPWDRRIAQ